MVGVPLTSCVVGVLIAWHCSDGGGRYLPGQWLEQAYERIAGRLRSPSTSAYSRCIPPCATAEDDTVQYGKNLDWKKEHYTTHDVASVFRRYLTQMPVSSMSLAAALPPSKLRIGTRDTP